MAKRREQEHARDLYLTGDYDQQRIAEIVGVGLRTLQIWIKKYGWKQRLEAEKNSVKNKIAQTRELTANLTAQRLEIDRQLAVENDPKKREQLQKEALRLTSEVGIYNKSLEKFDKENKVTLAVYLEVMEDIFKALRNFDPCTYQRTIGFQKEHAVTVSHRL